MTGRPSQPTQTWRTPVAAVCIALALLAALAVPSRAQDSVSSLPPGFLTILFGRTQWVQTDSDCLPQRKTVALDVVAAELRTRGLPATGTIVLNRIAETSRTCIGSYTLHPSWQDVATLRDDFGWTFVSASTSYRNMTLLTPQEQWNESCGSLPEFIRRGHLRADGLFAYPNDRSTLQIQTDVVSTCFAFGRKYGTTRTLLSVGGPDFQTTRTVNGGRCNAAALPCSTGAGTTRYTSPIALQGLAAAKPGEWASIQWYRFVSGTVRDGGKFEWDCRSADWRQHWTSVPELYCYQDFLSVLDAIPSTVTVTDPRTVAEAWGRW